MDRYSAKVLVDLAKEVGLEDVKLYEDYSGRFMYGEKTIGVKNLEISGLCLIIEHLYNSIAENLSLNNIDLDEVRNDTLGYGNIIY